MTYCPTCRQCGAQLTDRMEYTPCPEGCCRLWCCPDCGEEYASDGPVGCPLCSPISWLSQLTIAVYGWWLHVADHTRYWSGRLLCRLFGRHNVSCRGRQACADKLGPSRGLHNPRAVDEEETSA